MLSCGGPFRTLSSTPFVQVMCRPATLFLWSLLVCDRILPARSFVPPSTSSCRRRLSSACRLQIPAEIASLLPSEATTLLDGASWSDAALYGGLPCAALTILLSRPPSRLVSSRDLTEISQGTFLQGKDDDLVCLYKASRDGWSAMDFHAKVDHTGSGIVVARSLTGATFGGYNPAGWRSTDDYFTSTAAFLWARVRGNRIRKYPILVGGNAAVFDYATSGPNFGAGDLQIGPPQAAVMGGFAGPDVEDSAANAGNLRQAKSLAGLTYNSDGDWPARGTFVLAEVEVYGRPL